jgi:PilZ domain
VILPGSSGDADRRHFGRKRIRVNLEIEWGGATLNAMVRDIGPQGLFAELSPQLWVGAAFRARLIVNPVMDLNCTVRRVEPGKGIGLSFEVPEESSKAQIQALLADLPPL